MNKLYSKDTLKDAILFSALVFIVFLAFKITQLQNQIDDNEVNSGQATQLLKGSRKVAGFTCGVLNEKKAKDILSVSEVEMAYEQGPANEIQVTKPPLETIFWTDSCKYQATSNSNKYVELLVATFQTDDDARNAFPDFLNIVNDAEELMPGSYGQILFYDNGAYYLLKNHQVIQVSASNGNPGELELFSKQVYFELLSSL